MYMQGSVQSVMACAGALRVRDAGPVVLPILVLVKPGFLLVRARLRPGEIIHFWLLTSYSLRCYVVALLCCDVGVDMLLSF